MMSKRLLTAAALILPLAVLAEDAPAPQPPAPKSPAHADASRAKSDKAWSRLVESFAKALAEGDRPAVEGLMAAKSYIRRFEAGEFETSDEMLGRLARSTLVGQHAYFHPALVMAADVAADFKQATAVPDKVRISFLIDDQNEMKRANATAVQWLVEQLQTQQGAPVAVIVLWTPKPAAPAEAPEAADPDAKPADDKEDSKPAPPAFEPVFVILKGEETDPHRFRINYIVYGNPLAGRE
jgi:hypothetical protein